MIKKLHLMIINLFIVILLVASFITIGCGEEKPEKDKIVFGQAVSLTGPNAFIHESAAGPIQQMWIDQVNAKGGIYVEEYGKRLPIELIQYDDKSDHGTMVKLIEKLILEDEVDFLLPPCGTAFLYAATPIFDKHGYILLGGEGGASSLEELVDEYPYLFTTLNYSNHYQMPVLADIFEEVGVEKIAITYIEDLHGVEYLGAAVPEFEEKGFEIVMQKSHPAGIKDLSAVLKEAKSLGADAFCAFTYPDEVFLLTGQAVELNINFNAFLVGPGGCFTVYRDAIFSADLIDGVMFEGAWSPKQSAGAKEFYDDFVALYTETALDVWGHIYYWAGYQFFEKAIEEAGTLDQEKIKDIMATEKFETCLGLTWFDSLRRIARECHPGEIGQWQNGVAEVIDPDTRTAAPVYPKPDWDSPMNK